VRRGEDGAGRHFGWKNQEEKGEIADKCCRLNIKLEAAARGVRRRGKLPKL
jgi:hypothetical protein